VLLRDVIAGAERPRLIAVDHIVGNGAALFEAVRQMGGEGSSRSGRQPLSRRPQPRLAEGEGQ
jgi:hypothetical protein